MTPQELETYTLHRRFDRMGRLIGDRKMKKLMDSHVMIIGLGGVGSWAAESIVRSGIGRVTLVDFDEICVTNFNRQLHALQGLVGKDKAEVMGERMRKINPQAKIEVISKFYNADHCAEIFGFKPTNDSENSPSDTLNHQSDFVPDFVPDFVIDAIDNVTAKCHLLHFCHTHQIPIITSTGSGGRIDPSQIRIADLGKTEVDPLARSIRRILREKYGFPPEEGATFGISAVYSVEPPRAPEELAYDGGKGFRCVCPQGQNEFFNCDSRNLILGNASFVTGTFGLFCASHVIQKLTQELTCEKSS